MKSSIKIDSVFLSFGSKQVLRGINLEIKENQITGILGRNGCGKSCLLKIITGQLQSQAKYIAYNDKRIDNLYKEKGLINYLPQHEFHPRSSTLKKLLEFYEIDHHRFFNEYPFLKSSLNSRFSSMSGGEKRIIEVLLVLESNTKFSVLDEPFTHVMPKYINSLKERITKLSSKKGILVTDHQFQNVLNISDKSYIIVDGSIKKIEKIEDLKYYGYIR